MMYTNYTPMTVVWIVVLQALLSFVHAKASKAVYGDEIAKRNLGISLQFILLLFLISKYVELYALTLNHPKLIEPQDWHLLPVIVSVYVFFQVMLLAQIPTRIGMSLLVIGVMNVGFLSYLSIVST